MSETEKTEINKCEQSETMTKQDMNDIRQSMKRMKVINNIQMQFNK